MAKLFNVCLGEVKSEMNLKLAEFQTLLSGCIINLKCVFYVECILIQVQSVLYIKSVFCYCHVDEVPMYMTFLT